MGNEIWKDVKNFEGNYQVSNLGNVRSLDRVGHTGRKDRGKLKKLTIDGRGYLHVGLTKWNKKATRKVHQLVAESFLGHTVNGLKLVVNHIDLNRKNNNVNNIEIVTHRDNSNLKHIKSSSQYTGVCWSSNDKKWKATISINGKNNHLGYFTDEYEAHLAYEKALNKIKSLEP